MAETSWDLRAAALEMLAFTFRYPAQELADVVASGEWLEAAKEIAEAVGAELPADFAETSLCTNKEGEVVQDAEALLHVLRAEATRLFVGTPEAVVSPYEGVWRAGDDGVQALLFINPHSMAVERFIMSCGLDRPEGTNEPLDHIATELELLQYLAMLEASITEVPEGATAIGDLPGGSAQAAYAQFMEEHLNTWASRFAQSTAEETLIPYYRAAGQLLSAILPSCN